MIMLYMTGVPFGLMRLLAGFQCDPGECLSIVGVGETDVMKMETHEPRRASFDETGGASCGLDSGVIFRFSRNKFRGSLQRHDFLMFRIGGIELKKGVGEFLRKLRIEIRTHGPVVVEIRGRGRKNLHLIDVDFFLHERAHRFCVGALRRIEQRGPLRCDAAKRCKDERQPQRHRDTEKTQ